MLKSIVWEINKIFRKQNMLLFILLYVILHSMMSIPAIKAYDSFQTKEIKAYYGEYMKHIEGKITPDTERFLNDAQAELDALSDEIMAAKDQYINKQIASDTYQKLLLQRNKVEDQHEALHMLQMQLYAQKELPQSYQYMYDHKPDQVLVKQSQDFLLVFLLILFAVNLYYVDKDSEMETIILSSEKGRTYTRTIKIVILFVTTILLTLISEGIQLYAVYSELGAIHETMPIQSLVDFSSVAYSLSIGSALRALLLVRMMGYCLIAIFFSFLCNICKKITSIYGIALLLVLLPPFLLSESKFLYYNPLWGFMAPQNYIKDSVTGDVGYLFQKFDNTTLVLIFACAVVLLLLLTLYLYGFHFQKKHKKMLMVCMAAFLLTGCREKQPDLENTANIVNVRPLASYCSDSEHIYYHDAEVYHTYQMNQQTDTVFDRDIMEALNKTHIYAIVPAHQSIYYLRTYQTSTDLQIIKRNTQTMHEEAIYQTNTKHQAKSIVPFLQLGSTAYDSKGFPDSLAVIDDVIYIVFSNEIEAINMTSGTSETIVEDMSQVSFKDHELYYVDQKSNLMKLDLKSKQKKEVFSDLTEEFYVSEDGIYYVNMNDHNKLYVYSFETNTSVKFLDEEVRTVAACDDIVFYANQKGLYLYDIKDKTKQLVHKEGNGLYIVDERYVMYNNAENETVLYDRFTKEKRVLVLKQRAQ